MKRHMNQWIAAGTLGVMGFTGMSFSSGTAQAANSAAWKYGAIAGAGVAGYGLLKHNGRAATVGALAAAGSYYEYRKKKKEEDRQKAYRRRHHARPKSHHQTAEQRREAWYRHRYGKNWKSHYHSGH